MNKIEQDVQARYERARHLFKGQIGARAIAFNATIFPVWIGDSDCFWYERESRDGKQYRLVNAKAATNNKAFDHEALAEALANASGEEAYADNLSINKVEMDIGADNAVTTVRFSAFNKRWIFDAARGACQEIETPLIGGVVSPNGEHTVFTRDYNLWLRDLKSGAEKALTTDGEESYVYGAASAGWGHDVSLALQVRWSPDSKRVLTLQRDSRNVKSTPFVHFVPKNGEMRPTVEYRKAPYPGDDQVEEFRILSIDVETGELRFAGYEPIPATGSNFDYAAQQLFWWASNSSSAYFIDITRDCKSVRVVEFDTDTGECRQLFEETSATHICLNHNNDELAAILPLPESGELIWYSERTGWAHLYLYDLETGKLKNPITSGDWLVRNIVHFDVRRRELFLRTAGRVPGRDPYYCDLVRVNIDTSEMTTLVSSDHEYVAVSQTHTDLMKVMAELAAGRDVSSSSGVSNNGDFAVVTRSRADEAPVSLLVDRDGNKTLELEKADLSGLPEGWQWPEPVALKAADGKTDIYGLVYRPSNFSPEKSYPIISHVFNTPDLQWVPKGSFTNDKWFGAPYLDAAALAELGFIVVQIDGRGTPFREKAFFDHSYGWLETVGDLEDHIAGVRQLAERYPYMDLTRASCYAPWGGPGPVQGLLKHPDFYRVGVLEALHDSRCYGAAFWGDRFEGLAGSLLKDDKAEQYPEALAEKLQGKLLLMVGMLDTFSHPGGAFRLVESLARANKDFDLIVLPNHGHLGSPYLARRAWDFLVRHLLGVEPPKGFQLGVGDGSDLNTPMYPAYIPYPA